MKLEFFFLQINYVASIKTNEIEWLKFFTSRDDKSENLSKLIKESLRQGHGSKLKPTQFNLRAFQNSVFKFKVLPKSLRL